LRLTLTPIIFLVLWAGYIVATWVFIWRRSKDATQPRFYTGVKCVGLFVTFGSALLLPTAVPLPALSYWEAVLYWAIFTFPNALWGAYFALRWFYSIIGYGQKK
jgi:hypothetical protein